MNVDVTGANLVAREREAILRLMIHCVDQPSPNFCHILLGFDPKKQPSHDNLQVSVVIYILVIFNQGFASTIQRSRYYACSRCENLCY